MALCTKDSIEKRFEANVHFSCLKIKIRQLAIFKHDAKYLPRQDDKMEQSGGGCLLNCKSILSKRISGEGKDSARYYGHHTKVEKFSYKFTSYSVA